MRFKDKTPLDEREKKVLECVNTYTKEFAYLNLGDIVPYCTKSLSNMYLKGEIEDALKKLVENRYFLEDRIFLKTNLLENDIRKKILVFIKKNPGAYNRLIREKMELHSNEFEWHSAMLEKFGFIKKILLNKNQWGYFENKSYMNHEYDLFLLQKEKVSLILDYLQSNNNSGISKISEDLRMHYSTVKKYMNKLEERDIVRPIKNKGIRSICYEINSELMIILKKIINGQSFIEFGETPMVG